MNAQAQYWPQPYEGALALFKARESDTQYLGAGMKLGWEEHVRGEIRVVEIPGSHFSMMAEPGVSELVHQLRLELELAAMAAMAAGSPQSYTTAQAAPTSPGASVF